MRKVLILAALLAAAATAAFADGGTEAQVARNESLAIKNTVRAVLAGLGTPPAGYAQAKEDFDLPTAMGVDQATGRFWLTETGAVFEFTSGQSAEQMGQEYQQQIAAAQAKGDFEEMQRLAMEMQQKMLAAKGTEMSKVTVKVWLNRNAYQEIDPEGVVWESPGAIALRLEGADAGNARLLLAFDPRALADTQSLSLVSLSGSFAEPAAVKSAVRTVVVELTGPEAVVAAWADTVDRDAILGLIKG
jgi:hypothetical protein